LHPGEILNLATAFVAMGIEKIRLTGGEPTLRRDLVKIVEDLRGLEGLREIALTTNGFRLPGLLRELKQAGLDTLNVSVDSLRPGRFAAITGRDGLNRVLDSIEQALDLGFGSVKINAVLLKGLNDDETAEVAEFVRKRPVHWRWIELMRTGDNGDYFRRHFLSATDLAARFVESGWREDSRPATAGPARLFVHQDFRGSLGFISPYATDFCRACNRLRVSNTGALRLCLFGDGQFSLRSLLTSPDQRDELEDKVRALLHWKAPSHRLAAGDFGDLKNLAMIGG
jgi:cyclic pyranopterin phosphate synthase